ncbi:hypothetical protein [Sphingomonas morindae]|uniref:Glycosyltransferase n=1 Tax=Sphingomonas morindae TaxID=1541170 RepID=A0ABY4X6C0_9SPHN|nr:hypothetical protein [Sphingomonas morindae]USI72458.1 hypothetical protein LHA26_14345 [Sphingomonas morindae]
MEIVLLTVRPAKSDFRLHLARELQALGHAVTYIFLKRHPEITDMATGETVRWSLPRLVRWFAVLRRRRPAARPIVFNSTNLAFPGLSILLRAISGTRWCLDLHDDLLYNLRGAARTRAATAQRLLVASSDLLVHAAPSLKTLFPRSHHLGNGSSLQPLPKTDADERHVLILASLDGRFDFALMRAAAAACPDRVFEIWGRVSQDDPAIAAALERLVADTPNIRYNGPYTDPELPALLARYLVAFAPYKVGDRLTEFIDPLRFYHCLASRTGLVSTPIPQALTMADQIVLVRDAAEVDAALTRAAADRPAGGRSWADVAKKLVPLLETIN